MGYSRLPGRLLPHTLPPPCVERDDPLFREYEEVVLTAARELDPEKRVELYTRSDEILINEAAIVTPTYYYGGPFLRKPNIKAPESLTGTTDRKSVV